MIQLENRWTDLDEIWYGRYAIGDNPKIERYNFLQSVIPTWRANKLVRWNRHNTRRHQVISFKITPIYNVATRTAELTRLERFEGLLTSNRCNIFICNRINEMF
jgi:hypothetical protein